MKKVNEIIQSTKNAVSCCGPSQEELANLQQEQGLLDVKAIVQQKYGQIAQERADGKVTSCCGASPNDDKVYNIMSDDYSTLDGYEAIADMNLGCGLPTEFAQISKGDVVVDLGSGAGNDCFVARAETGETGQVIGVDFTPAMLAQARQNATKLGYDNVTFVEGDIENIPLEKETVDVVVSNCVFNLVPNKKRAFEETYRILTPGGHFSISDIVLEGDLPKGLQHAAEMYAGCVAGAIQLDDYLAIIRDAGFQDIVIQKKKPIQIPETILAEFLDEAGLAEFNKMKGIYSITVYAER